MDKLMSDFTGLDRKGSLDAIFQLAIASEMCSGVGHIIKNLSPQNSTNDFKCGKLYLIWLVIPVRKG
jgi:hypothetical protein